MTIFNILLIIHVIGGIMSLGIGTIILILKKGDKRHKKMGLIFYYSMLSSAFVSIPLASLHPNLFLFIIGIWTLYMLYTGKRFLKIKRKEDVTILDKTISIAALLFGMSMIGLGLRSLYLKNNFGIVCIVFGAIILLFVSVDYKSFTGHQVFENFGLTIHIQRMVGAFIASATAFLVVNNTLLPNVIAWLLPSLLLVPLIVFWIRRYGRLKG